jgi:predicted nucleic-acid-binding Zn-ribbon protein
MNKGSDIQFIREHYQRMSNEEVIRIATQDAAGLTPEAQEIIKEEVEKRNLDTNILKGVQAQNKSYTVAEIDEYCGIARNLSCPDCGSNLIQLNGTMTSEVMSFVVFTQHKKQLKVACPTCLEKANNKALTTSLALGWWGIPWGIVRTIQAISHNMKSKKANNLLEPNDYLRSFVLSKVGLFETYKNDKEKLQQLIAEN